MTKVQLTDHKNCQARVRTFHTRVSRSLLPIY